MTRLLFDGRFFGARTRHEILESQYENLLLANASLLFPGFHMINFRPNVRSGTRTKQPDFALIEHNYQTWWVVEVELSHHSFSNHVLPQVEVFKNGDYTEDHANILINRAPEGALDPDRVRSMVRGTYPGVQVIVEKECSEWEGTLKHLGVMLTVIEVFRSFQNEHAFRLTGDLPTSTPDGKTECVDAGWPKLRRVTAPGVLPFQAADGPFPIEWEGTVSNWVRIDTADDVFLSPSRGDPLEGAGPSVVLEIGVGGQVRFVRVP